MKKVLSILLVLMLTVLPCLAEQTGIQAQRQAATVELTSPLLEGLSFKVEEDIQDGEYAHELVNLFLNGDELMSEGVMLDVAAKQLFISFPAMFENVLVFDEEDLKTVVNTVSDVLVEMLNELKNDPEFIYTMAELLEALDEAVKQAIAEAQAEAEAEAALEAVLAPLNYDHLAEEMESIFTPVKTVYPSEDGTSLTDYSYTLDQSVADRFIAAVEAFFAENAKALGDYAPDAATLAEFKAIVDELMAGFSVSGSVGMDSKGNLSYLNLKMDTEEDGDTVSIALTAADVKDGEKENVVLAFDVTVNGESAGVSILVEDAENGVVIRAMANAGEESTEVGRIEVKSENENDTVIRFVLGSAEEEMELARINVHIETLEPNIAFVEGGETDTPLKMSSEELGEFMQNAVSHYTEWKTELGAKIEVIMAPLVNAMLSE